MKECKYCGGSNAPENRVCDFCGMSFDEDTIPEGSVDPRETARLEAEALRESRREKDLIEMNLDKSEDQNITINMPTGQKVVINDPIEKATDLAESILSSAASSAADRLSETDYGKKYKQASEKYKQAKRIAESSGCLSVFVLLGLVVMTAALLF